MPLPSSPFAKAKSIYAGLCIVEFTPDGGSAVTFETKMLTQGLEQETKDIELPDAKGVLRKVRTVLVKQQESFTFELMEVKRLLDIFGNAMAGRVTGICTLYIPDPDDATGKLSLKSETGFACTITRDGNVDFGNGDFSKATIKVESNKQGAISWTPDWTIV